MPRTCKHQEVPTKVISNSIQINDQVIGFLKPKLEGLSLVEGIHAVQAHHGRDHQDDSQCDWTKDDDEHKKEQSEWDKSKNPRIG